MERARFGGALVPCSRGKEAHEDQNRQGAPKPRAASRSAAAYPFARGVPAFVWDGVQEIDTSPFCFTWARGRAYDVILNHVKAGLITLYLKWCTDAAAAILYDLTTLNAPSGKHHDQVESDFSWSVHSRSG